MMGVILEKRTLFQYAWSSRVIFVALGLIVALVVVIGVAFDNYNSKQVEYTDSIGKLISVQFLEDEMTEGKGTQVTTDKGGFLVKGVFQGEINNEILLETRKNTSKYLCDKKLNTCRELVGIYK